VKALGRPVAGKTGTTNDFKDAWFLGYVPQMITGVWVGFDEGHPLGRNETGGRSAAPIWLDFMKVATEGVESKEWVAPESVIQMEIDGETGDLPTAATKKRIKEFFADGTAPGQTPKAVLTDTTGKAVAQAAEKTGGQPNGQDVKDSNPLSSTGTQVAINRTVTITGNPDVGAHRSNTNSPAQKPAESESSELFRDDL
jgi:membrane carboxypeptidase/penicillin-binding protein